MYAPRPAMATSETNKPRQSKKSSLGLWLLIWAYFRIGVSCIWSTIILIAAAQDLFVQNQHGLFGLIALMVQITEMTMLATFIAAGHKKSVKLYRIYFYYTIVTLLLYIVSTVMIYLTDVGVVYLFVQNYLSFHFLDLPIVMNDELLYIVIVIVDVCLEILLLILIKKQIKKCSIDTEDDEDLRTEGQRAVNV